MEIEEDVVIAGAGITGLATALALKKVGIRSLVLEKSHKLRATGTAVALFKNAWLALDQLDIAHKITSLYTPLQKGHITNLTDGTVTQFFQADNNRNVIGPTTIHRSTLLEALSEELPVDAIRFSSKLRSIETLRRNGSTITSLILEDGTIIKAKLVIGCDGVHSVVGRWLGLSAPIYSGRVAVRGLSMYPHGHGLKHELHHIFDGHTKVGIVPFNDKELYWFSMFSEDENMTRRSPEFIQKYVSENMAHFPSIFLDVVHHSDLSTLSWHPMKLRVPWTLLVSRLYKDNVTVAGVAMHPMTPDIAQGCCSSLEDAIILARHMVNAYVATGMIDSRALKEFAKERRWRAAMLISASYISGWIQQGGSGWLMQFLREKVFNRCFPLLNTKIVQFNCGKLPSVGMKIEDSTTRKSK